MFLSPQRLDEMNTKELQLNLSFRKEVYCNYDLRECIVELTEIRRESPTERNIDCTNLGRTEINFDFNSKLTNTNSFKPIPRPVCLACPPIGSIKNESEIATKQQTIREDCGGTNERSVLRSRERTAIDS